MQQPQANGSKQLPDYYIGLDARPELGSRFQNIDAPSVLQSYRSRLAHSETHNFVVDFGPEDAWCATNLEVDDIKELLSNPVRVY